MSCLKLYLFGPPRIELDDRLIDLPRRKVMALLGYLAVTGKRHQRDTLANLFWPESGQTAARGALRRELYTLTSTLGSSWFQSSWENIAISSDADVWTDVSAFRSLLAEVANHSHAPNTGCVSCLAALRDAVDLYTSDFLTGFTLADSLEFDEWQRFEAESLRREFTSALAKLIQFLHTQGEYTAAIGYARRWLALDPLQEAAYRTLMQLYALAGEDGAAIRQYEECVRILAEEIGAPPANETTELYNAIRTRRFAAVKSAHSPYTPVAETASTDTWLRRASPTWPTAVVTPSVALEPLSNQRTVNPIPLIGRNKEWGQLQTAWQTVQQTGIHCVVIAGEAGIGKTRLAEEMLIWAQEQSIHTAQARAYATQEELAYGTVVELLHTTAFQTRLKQLNQLWLSHLARLLPDLLQRHPDLTLAGLEMDSWQRHQLFEALTCTCYADTQSLLIILNDLQWADHETIAWLHYLLCATSHHNTEADQKPVLLVVGTVRTGEIATDHALHRFLWDLRRNDRLTEIDLKPLDSDETTALAKAVAKQVLAPALLKLLQQTTEGNPLFIVETVRSVLEDGTNGLVQQTPSDLELANRSVSTLPPKVYTMIQARLAQLSPQAQEIASLAAVIGRFFSFDLLAAASQLDEESLATGLDELWERRIIHEQGTDAYDFSHDRIREVAYHQVGRARRRLLHRRVAEALEIINAHRLDSISSELATHYEQAGLTKRAIEAYSRAAITAQQMGAYRDGIALIQRGLALLKTTPDTLEKLALELAFQFQLAPIQRTTLGYAASAQGLTLARARTLSQLLNKQDSLHHVLIGLFSHKFVRAEILESKQIAEELWEIAQTSPELMILMEAGHAMGGHRWAMGDFQTAHSYFEPANAQDDPIHQQNHIHAFGFNLCLFNRSFDAHALWMLGRPDQAVQQIQATIAQARTQAHPVSLALTLAYAAMLYQFRREPVMVQQLAAETIAVCVKHGNAYYQLWATMLHTWAEAIQGNSANKLALIQQTIEDFKATESRIRLPFYLSLVVELFLLIGEPEQGLATLREAEELAIVTQESWWIAELHRLRGELLQYQGDPPATVELCFGEAIEIARRQQAKLLELRATVSLARLWKQQGKQREAQQHLTELLNSFTEGWDTPDLQAAQTLLSQLRGQV